jgi:uncharacterized protein
MANINYLPRICDALVQKQLTSSGAVLIEGAKWCGKTSTARQASKSVLYMQDPDKSQGYLSLADTMPSLLLKGENPRLIDEWQMAPVLWDAVRFEVDKRGKMGQFLLTGSTVPRDGVTAHTGTGRISRFTLRPMSLFESNDSNGSVSLRNIFSRNFDIQGESPLTVPDIAKLICRGGWPEAVVNKDETFQMATNYVNSLIEMDGVDRNPERVRLLLRSYARNISTLAALSTIQGDIEANDKALSENTLYNYANTLRRLFVIEDVPAWQPSLRSKTAIRTSDKRQFVDPSIATAVMQANQDSILQDFNYFGFLFESLCTRDMRVYAQANNGDVFHYRDKDELESDLIVRLRDGRWAAIEVKLGSKDIEAATVHLTKLKEKINVEKMGEPSFLMVITGGQYAYRRKDGVLIVPIGCLRD